MRGILVAIIMVPSIAHAEPKRHRWDRMLEETAGIFAFGEGYYWSDPANSYDRQLPGSSRAIERKLEGAGVRYDSNDFVTNAGKHPVVFGATVHALARENGFSFAESFLISTAVSASWETFGEWREFASINDLAVTSPGGAPVGEAVYEMLHDRQHTGIEAHAGAGQDNGSSYNTVGASAVHGDVQLAAEMAFDTAPRAYYLHAAYEVAGIGTGAVHLGARATYDYAQKEQRVDSEWDRQAAVGIGPALAVATHAGPVAIHGGIDASPEFAMVKSDAYAQWRDEHPMAIVQGVLQTNATPYYYAAGLAVTPRLALDLGRFTIGGRLARNMYASLGGPDRDSGKINTHIDLSDRDNVAETWIGMHAGSYMIALDGREEHRSGDIGAVHGASSDRTWLVSVGYRR